MAIKLQQFKRETTMIFNKFIHTQRDTETISLHERKMRETAKQQETEMTSRAELFILILALACASHAVLKPQFLLCESKFVDFEQQKTDQFLANFFNFENKSNISSQNDFVYDFNSNVLKLHVAAKKINVFVPVSPLEFEQTKLCNCGVDYIEFETWSQCSNCGCIERQHDAIAWADVSRVHSAPVYMNDRKIQFKEWLLQFQGKGRTVFELDKTKHFDKSMTKLEFLHQIKRFPPAQKFHTDQIHALYYAFKNIEPPNLTQVENRLLCDFDLFSSKYSKSSCQKNFNGLNQFLLFQFLKRYKIAVSLDDVLLTDIQPDRGCIEVFASLGWTLFR